MAPASGQSPAPKRPWILLTLILGTFLVALALATAYVYLVEPALARRPAFTPTDGPPPGGTQPSTPFYWPGIRHPPTRPADRVELADDAEVVGVTVGGKARAYVLDAFRGPTRHVVNDLVEDVPVTITFCDRTGCVKTFTSDGRGTPLDVDTGGWYQNRLFLRVGGDAYYQDAPRSGEYEESPPFPYADLPVVRTTWKAWKTDHPETDVYVGPEEAEAVPAVIRH